MEGTRGTRGQEDRGKVLGHLIASPRLPVTASPIPVSQYGSKKFDEI
ncbi:MAG: hypothetical protein NHB32_19030 [Fischerella sp. CENA71]|nr:hypothetical protein [Fischerella sp. CENA71]